MSLEPSIGTKNGWSVKMLDSRPKAEDQEGDQIPVLPSWWQGWAKCQQGLAELQHSATHKTQIYRSMDVLSLGIVGCWNHWQVETACHATWHRTSKRTSGSAVSSKDLKLRQLTSLLAFTSLWPKRGKWEQLTKSEDPIIRPCRLCRRVVKQGLRCKTKILQCLELSFLSVWHDLQLFVAPEHTFFWFPVLLDHICWVRPSIPMYTYIYLQSFYPQPKSLLLLCQGSSSSQSYKAWRRRLPPWMFPIFSRDLQLDQALLGRVICASPRPQLPKKLRWDRHKLV